MYGLVLVLYLSDYSRFISLAAVSSKSPLTLCDVKVLTDIDNVLNKDLCIGDEVRNYRDRARELV